MMSDTGFFRRNWNALAKRIQEQNLTPIIGGDIFTSYMLHRNEALQAWAEEIGYPGPEPLDITNLMRFATLELVQNSVVDFFDFYKDFLLDRYDLSLNNAQLQQLTLSGLLREVRLADRTVADDQALDFLTSLDVPLYITTSQHYFLEQLLESKGKKPKTEVCMWRKIPQQPTESKLNRLGTQIRRNLVSSYTTSDIKTLCFDLGLKYDNLSGDTIDNRIESLVELTGNQKMWADMVELAKELNSSVDWGHIETLLSENLGTATEPIVYHLFGLEDYPESMVLTDDDYLDFLLHIGLHNTDTISLKVKKALAENALLMLGYNVNKWDFKVLFRGLITSRQRAFAHMNVSIQIEQDDLPSHKRKAFKAYFKKLFKQTKFTIFWGKPEAFIDELRNYLPE